MMNVSYCFCKIDSAYCTFKMNSLV